MSANQYLDNILESVAAFLDKRPDISVRLVAIELSKHTVDPVDAILLDPSQGGGTMQGDTGGAVHPAFNLAGHAVIAYIAQQYLEQNDQKTYRTLQGVMAADPLGRGDVGDFAEWPDKLKHPPAGQTADFAKQKQRLGGNRGTWHYVNIPFNPAEPDAAVDLTTASGDLLKQLPGQLKLLASSDPLTAADALCYVLHLVGDLHQPLHCAAYADEHYFPTPPEFDQGGNLIRWGADKPRTNNLHALLDDAIAAGQSEIEARISEIMTSYPRAKFADDKIQLGLDAIALESFEIAKSVYTDFFAEATYLGESEAVKGGQQFSAPSPKFRADIRNDLCERCALAAYRLASLLATYLQK